MTSRQLNKKRRSKAIETKKREKKIKNLDQKRENQTTLRKLNEFTFKIYRERNTLITTTKRG